MTSESLQTLVDLAAIRVAGPDANNFLQGQLSNDLQRLSSDNALPASCNSPQGRVQAVLNLIERADGIWLLLPQALLQTTFDRLRKYVLRAKVTLTMTDASVGFFAASREALHRRHWPLPDAATRHVQTDAISVVRWFGDEERYLAIQPSRSALENSPLPAGDSSWRLADIRAGLPQVFPETHEAFVAQMLNLDAIGGISFNKGCYTGQEIIARAHYRGAVKRRMFRLRADSAPPAPGSRILSQGARAGDVVMSAATESGCELLAVLNLSSANTPLELADTPAASLTMLALPYTLPTVEAP